MPIKSSPWKLGVDVGGTFTDAVLYNDKTGALFRAKVPTTPEDQSEGVLNAISDIKRHYPDAGGEDISVSVMNHGTTVATNAILEGKGARVALLVTEGYKQVLQIRRSAVPGGLAGWIVWPKPEPLAALEMTIEVPGRISSSGEIVRPLDANALRSQLLKLKSLSPAPESITISLINSFINPIHEQEAAKLVQDEFPGVPLSLSSDILPELMEYERTITTVANAYVKPIVSQYLANLQAKLEDTELRVLRSDGGLAGVNIAKEHCAQLLYSGPAGGVAGVISQIAEKTRFKNLLTFDMGGTSTDVCLVENGIPGLRRESVIGDLTIRAPSIDVRTVGAGGGSIATVAEITGALRVGPESAGANPGPACYSKGGKLPTVTDAFAVLGYLPAGLLGGTFQLDVSAAICAIREHVAGPMNITLYEAAEGIIRIAAEKMYGSLRSVTVEKGKDPRSFHLVSFGGAGGLLACRLSDLCGTAYPTIVPPSPGVLCAFGDACTGLRHEISATLLRPLADVNVEEIVHFCSQLQHRVSDVLIQQSIPIQSQIVTFEVDLRYRGQAASLPIPFTLEELSVGNMGVIEKRFENAHEEYFTFSLDLGIEMACLRVVARERTNKIVAHSLEAGNGTPNPAATKALTSLFYSGREFANVPVFDRSVLCAGDILKGPCIISELDSNTLITPSHRAEIDMVGNILIWPAEAPPALILDEAGRIDPITVQLVEGRLFCY